MKIVATDGFALNPGDLNWESIARLGDLTIFDRTTTDEIVERCAQADIILTNKVAFSRETLEKLPNLRCICVLATGYNIIDTHAARERGVVVCNVPDYSSASVAQHTFAFILELANQIGLHSQSVRNGDWVNCKDFSYALTPLIELQGKSLGLVGFGNIGRKTAQIGKAFGMNVKYFTPSEKETDLADYLSLEELFSSCDFVSLHLPLKPDNQQFVNRELLGMMKNTAFLINTSRGQLIHEQDLADALNAGTIAGAALDVLSVEPPPASNPLLNAKNCILSPHNAWMSREARERIMSITEGNIRAFMENKPINVVN
ncbi:D-2-hydroxyacid dehydrogenase [Pedobacter sp. SYSU D00535]|uniref:D-2-hydroxyacid dehydrogenase n=1 Tax=Pedobacter sp. SYSU D00535 TaxID=2810308 RepID=UPI001A970880|nr:D-2-hydroxyacid dehydrogenase [Pedobacter sp. SYSU D00535]